MTNFMDDLLNSFLIFVEKTYLKSGCLSIPTVSYIGQSFFKLYKGWCRKAVCACPCYTKSYCHIVVTCAIANAIKVITRYRMLRLLVLERVIKLVYTVRAPP